MKAVTILLNSIRSSRDEMFLNVTDDQMEAYARDRGINFQDEDPNPAPFNIDCDEENSLPTSVDNKKVNVLSVYVDASMVNQYETIMVPDGARCQISVSNRTNFLDFWENAPIWFVEYAVYHGKDTDIEIISGDSSKEQSAYFQRIPECYLKQFDQVRTWFEKNDKAGVSLFSPYDPNNVYAKVLAWLVADNFKSGHSQCDDVYLLERATLGALNFAAPIASASNDTADTLWIDAQQQCSWNNIACDSGSVTSLMLYGLNLTGTIPAVIGLLPGLQQANFGTWHHTATLMLPCIHLCDWSVVRGG